jgi:hypothetical protein
MQTETTLKGELGWSRMIFRFGGDQENADEQERREESVDHGGIEEGFHRTNFSEVNGNADYGRTNDDAVKSPCRFEFRVQPLMPAEGLGISVGRRAGERQDCQKTDS